MAPQHPLIDQVAPSFSIPDSNGDMFKFPPEQEGKPVERPIALFFYPKSGKLAFPSRADLMRFRCTGTYGCTREACHFRDALAGGCLSHPREPVMRHSLTIRTSEEDVYKRSDVLVVGVSSDPVDKQKAFVEKHKLPVSFP